MNITLERIHSSVLFKTFLQHKVQNLVSIGISSSVRSTATVSISRVKSFSGRSVPEDIIHSHRGSWNFVNKRIRRMQSRIHNGQWIQFAVGLKLSIFTVRCQHRLFFRIVGGGGCFGLMHYIKGATWSFSSNCLFCAVCIPHGGA